MIYVIAVLGGLAAAFYLFIGLVILRAIIEIWREDHPSRVQREAESVAAQAWRAS